MPALLEPALGEDWSAPVPGLDFTVTERGGPRRRCRRSGTRSTCGAAPENASFEVQVLDDTGNQRLLTSLLAASEVLAAAVDAAPSSLRGFHPFGSPDPSGFAAMACDELLVHGRDAALGLGREFEGDAGLARGHPGPALPVARTAVRLTIRGRCCCGRTGGCRSADRQDQERWRWHCAPLSEWDGSGP